MLLVPLATLSREHWIEVARRTLVRGGVAAIKVDQLARKLRVTRGSFYWHFKDRNDLLRSLLLSWKDTNTLPFHRVMQENVGKPVYQLAEFFCIWLRAEEFDPDYDSAVRDWARTSASTAGLVKQVDDARIDILRRLFFDLDYARLEADIRARVMYYHQVGYYALRLRETTEYWRSVFPTYFEVLVGQSLPSEYLDTHGSLVPPPRLERQIAT